MPYIKTKSRERYNPLILEAIQTVMSGNEYLYIKGEYFGYLVMRLIRGYLNTTDKNNPAFNSSMFVIAKQKKLVELTDKLLIYLNQEDPLESSGELNYVISAIFWGIQGAAEGIDKANYGFRAYLRGMLENVRDNMSSAPFSTTGEQKDRLKAGRRYVLTLGVLCDVVTEGYSQLTSKYESGKKLENGSIWVNGKLLPNVDS